MSTPFAEPEAYIFDLGGVLLNLDGARTPRAFQALGEHIDANLWRATTQQPFFVAYEVGKIDSDAFREGLRQALHLRASDAQIDAAWCAMIKNFPRRNVELLLRLRRRHRTFLLSNTNEIHLRCVDDMLGRRDALVPYFEKVYFSHRIGARKPNMEAFAHVVEDSGLEPERTVFIDDLEANVLAARAVGLRAIHLRPGIPVHMVLPVEEEES